MPEQEYDVAVIGGGSGGYAAARVAAAEGKKVAVIDGADELGGLCILRGCMPSKTLIETSNRTLAIRNAKEFGINVSDAEIDLEVLASRKRALIGDFKDYRKDQLMGGCFDLLRGYAQFSDSTRINISLLSGEEITISAQTTIVATGSAIHIPEINGLAEVGYLTSDDVLEDTVVPESIIVLGGGAIAVEMAHFYEGIGKKVTVIQRSNHLLSELDHDVADELESALVARSMEIYCGTDIRRIFSRGDKKVVEFMVDDELKTVEADEILCALGRKANTEKLALDAAGVEVERGKVKVGITMQSSSPNIFAAGDVCGPYEIVHLAIEQGELAARNALLFLEGINHLQFLKMDYRLKLYGIFTEPQVASVGLTEKEARDENLDILVATYPFNDHGKSMIHGTDHGFVKLIADANSKEILGAAIVGPEAVELIHEIVVAMNFHATANQLAKIPHYHPTLSEIWTYPAEEIAEG